MVMTSGEPFMLLIFISRFFNFFFKIISKIVDASFDITGWQLPVNGDARFTANDPALRRTVEALQEGGLDHRQRTYLFIHPQHI